MIGSSRVQQVLLVAMFLGMAFCARTPDAGAGWRTAYVLCALAAGIIVFMQWQSGNVSMRKVIVVGILLRVIVFPLTPTLSDDGYRYVWDGMLQAQEGINPYHYTPSDSELSHLHDDPVFENINSGEYFSVYPPVSQVVFALGGLMYPLGWQASWYLIKLLMVGGEVLGLLLLSRMVRPRELLLYAWHPLVVMETAGQAHTESLAAGLLVLMVWAIRRTRKGTTGSALSAAGWLKLLPFAFTPFVVRRIGWKAAVAGLVVSVALAAPYTASYVIPHVRESLNLYVRLFEFNSGPYLAMKGIFAGLGLGDVSKILGPVLQWAFVGLLFVTFFLDWKRGWSIEKVLIVVLSLFFLCATTVHPWYLVPLLALLPLVSERKTGRWFAIAWSVLGVISLATYWRYSGPPWGYALAVWTGWILWTGFMLIAFIKATLPSLMRRRAQKKWRWIQSQLPPPQLGRYSRVLDLGAGEGFVGEAIENETGAQVLLADVVDFNETDLPLTLYTGCSLPFEDERFDTTLLVFVLHHAENAEQVLLEAARATSRRIVVVESVYSATWQHRLLDRLDRLANALRSSDKMADQEEYLHFRTDAEWRSTFSRLGFTVKQFSEKGRWIHQQVLYVLQPPKHQVN